MSEVLTMMIGPILLIHLFYFIAVIKKNLSVIDTAWSLGFILMALTGFFYNTNHSVQELAISILVLFWGVRLSAFIHFRNSGKGEDFRYAAWRKDWGAKTNLIAYFKVYWLQFALMQIVALPIFAAHFSLRQEFSALNLLGLIFWTIGFIWETVADYQKNEFKSIPGNQHRICKVGLWNFSRHANYFGETLLWWGIGLIAFSPETWWCLLGPLFLNFLLLKVSGVPLIEARHLKNPEFAQYAAETPVMIPSLTKILKAMKERN